VHCTCPIRAPTCYLLFLENSGSTKSARKSDGEYRGTKWPPMAIKVIDIPLAAALPPSYLLPSSCYVHLPFWNQYLSSPSTLPAPMPRALSSRHPPFCIGCFEDHHVQLCCLAFDLAPRWDVNACADSQCHRIVSFQVPLTTYHLGP
jgi:hypothetical protein